MIEEKQTVTFEELYNRDITKYVEKLEKRYKDKKTGEWKSFFLSYLSWAYGHREMKRIDPDAKEEVHEFPLVANGQVINGVTVPYLQTPQGFFVKCSVTINGRAESEWLPVLDNSNKPVDNPNSFQINTSHKRCFVKALAKHGLGLYLYVGEDLPENISNDQPEPNVTTQPNNQPQQTKMPDDFTQNRIDINERLSVLAQQKNTTPQKLNEWILVRTNKELNRSDKNITKENIASYNKQLRSLESKAKLEDTQAEQTSLMNGNTTTPVGGN